MSLTAQIAEGIQAAFTAAGDLVQTGQIQRTTRGEYDPVEAAYPESTQSWTGKAITESYSAYEIDGAVIQVGDVKVLWLSDSANPDPEPGDRLTLGGETFRIINNEPIKPGDTVFLHVIQARR